MRDEISALSKRIQSPVKVSLGGEVAIKPDETNFMTFSSNIYDQYAEATLLSSSFPEDDYLIVECYVKSSEQIYPPKIIFT